MLSASVTFRSLTLHHEVPFATQAIQWPEPVGDGKYSTVARTAKGASAKTKGLFYATGHGHLGLTYAATNARLMADLITGATPPIDMMPFRVDRF